MVGMTVRDPGGVAAAGLYIVGHVGIVFTRDNHGAVTGSLGLE
jgi:hypothetical protein